VACEKRTGWICSWCWNLPSPWYVPTHHVFDYLFVHSALIVNVLLAQTLDNGSHSRIFRRVIVHSMTVINTLIPASSILEYSGMC
jgi:hypothetical protein